MTESNVGLRQIGIELQRSLHDYLRSIEVRGTQIVQPECFGVRERQPRVRESELRVLLHRSLEHPDRGEIAFCTPGSVRECAAPEVVVVRVQVLRGNNSEVTLLAWFQREVQPVHDALRNT